MNKINLLGILAISILSFASCSDDNDKILKTVKQSFTNLPDLGANYVYEGWLISGTKKISTGRFTSAAGKSKEATIPLADFKKATKYVLTIEPAKETGAALTSPSGYFFSKGAFADGKAAPSLKEALYTGTTTFSGAAGQFFLKAPSATATGKDKNGIWFINRLPPTGGGFTNLPTLTDKWVYEGWVVVKDKNDKVTPISTGTFSDPMKADLSGNKFKGAGNVPPFPGEDFIKDTNPAKYKDVVFPIDLTNATIVISIEPKTDDSLAPFGLKPFKIKLKDQPTGVKISMDNTFKSITGRVTSK